MSEVIANDDLECLTTEATHTKNFVDNELTNAYKTISNCLDALQDTVFAGPAAESSRKGSEDLLAVINDPIMTNFNNISVCLTDAHKILTETDEKVKNNVSFVYDEEKGFQLQTIPDNLYIDPKTGMVFPIANGEGQIDRTYGQFGSWSQGGYGGYHNGIDVVAKVGTEIHAASDAEVYYCGWDKWTSGSGGYGNCVVLRSKDSSGNYIYQIYAHMQSNPGLKQGSTVSAGQVIGKVGTSGNTPGGAHLHYEIRNGMTWNGDVSLGLGKYYNFNNIRV